MEASFFVPKNEECPGTLRYPGYYEKIYSFKLIRVSVDNYSIAIKYEQNVNKI